MFNNVGGKIKVWAQIICYVGIALSILGCLGNLVEAINFYDSETAVLWVLRLVLYPIGVWISSAFLYGIGQLVENSDTLIDLLTDDEDSED